MAKAYGGVSEDSDNKGKAAVRSREHFPFGVSGIDDSKIVPE
jgi:hypothetical protein